MFNAFLKTVNAYRRRTMSLQYSYFFVCVTIGKSHNKIDNSLVKLYLAQVLFILKLVNPIKSNKKAISCSIIFKQNFCS